MCTYPKPSALSEAGNASRLNCGLVRDFGMLRISTRISISLSLSRPVNSGSGRVEWPMVKKGVFMKRSNNPARSSGPVFRIFPPAVAGQPRLAADAPEFVGRVEEAGFIECADRQVDFVGVDVRDVGHRSTYRTEVAPCIGGTLPGFRRARHGDLLLQIDRVRTKRRTVHLAARHAMAKANAIRPRRRRKAPCTARAAAFMAGFLKGFLITVVHRDLPIIW